MAFLIGGANSAADTGYEVANSCRFNRPDSAYLNFSQGNGNRKDFTWSGWIKRSSSGLLQLIWHCNNAGHYSWLGFDSSDRLQYYSVDGSTVQGSFVSTQVFRDQSAWYHIVARFEMSNATEDNRIRFYVNGSEITVWTTKASIPSQNTDLEMNVSGHTFRIGTYANSSDFVGMYMSEISFCDGQSYAPTSFGEFDEDSPTIWKPKDISGLTFGTNGFWLDFEDSSALGNDVSGENNDFTPANLAATDQATDTPTNNFATLNGVFNTPLTLAEGNLKATEGSSVWNYIQGTIAVASGKWYWECKCKGDYLILGVIDQDEAKGYAVNDRNPFSSTDISTRGFGYYNGDGKYYSNGSGNTYGDTFASDDIIGVALDCDNKKLYFSKNGTFQDSGDPTSGATGTGAISLNSNTSLFGMAIAVQNNNTEVNFGSPSYANSSDAADANGYGAFEYSPPSGYLSLCTKNLGSDGG